MEKYGKWRDGETSIHPFLPPQPKISLSKKNVFGKLLQIFKNYVVGMGLGLIRLGLLIFISVYLYISNMILKKMNLKKFVDLNISITCRVILFVIGFVWIEEVTKSSSTGKPTSPQKETPKPGDIIISNHTSYLDQLYLAYYYNNPIFCSSSDINNLDLLKRESLFSSMKNSIWPRTKDINCTSTIEDLCVEAKEEDKVIILFPEATTSNGECFLDPVHNLSHLKKQKPNFFACLLQYPYSEISPSFTVQNFFFHLFALCSEFVSYLCVTRVNKLDAFPVQDEQSKIEDLEEWEDQLHYYMTKCTGLKFVSLGIKDKMEFMDYWEKTQSGKDPKKKK